MPMQNGLGTCSACWAEDPAADSRIKTSPHGRLEDAPFLANWDKLLAGHGVVGAAAVYAPTAAYLGHTEVVMI